MAARRPAGGALYVARESFSTEHEGAPVAIVKGVTRVREGHPILKGREDFFELIEPHFEVAAPGEPRGETRG